MYRKTRKIIVAQVSFLLVGEMTNIGRLFKGCNATIPSANRAAAHIYSSRRERIYNTLFVRNRTNRTNRTEREREQVDNRVESEQMIDRNTKNGYRRCPSGDVTVRFENIH